MEMALRRNHERRKGSKSWRGENQGDLHRSLPKSNTDVGLCPAWVLLNPGLAHTQPLCHTPSLGLGLDLGPTMLHESFY